MVLPYHGILLSNKKGQTKDTCDNSDESPENYTEAQGNFVQVTEIFYISIMVVGVTQLQVFVKTHRTIHLKGQILLYVNCNSIF